jgi:hypothetical protein
MPDENERIAYFRASGAAGRKQNQRDSEAALEERFEDLKKRRSLSPSVFSIYMYL